MESPTLEPDVVSCCLAGDGPLSNSDADRLAGMFRALADPVRLRLFADIASQPDEVCVCNIRDVGVSQPTVSHHLKKLREAGLLTSQRRGTWVYYQAVPQALDAMKAALAFPSSPARVGLAT